MVAADQPLAWPGGGDRVQRPGLTYWALTHPGAQADFHRRDSFQVEL